MSVSVVIVKKTGVLQDRIVKEYNESTLYKEAGFKSGEGFVLKTIWQKYSINRPYSVSLYAKEKGKAGQENKYDFPPPVDNSLYFGSCLLIAISSDGRPINLSTKDWIAIYEHLFGGFEDLGSEDSEESVEDLSDVDITKEGYVKDGFIVDDDEEEGEDSSYEEIPAKKLGKSRAKQATKVAIKVATKQTIKTKQATKQKLKNEVIKKDIEESNENYLECTSELTEEAYME
jgi:hypothetical protein